MLASTRSISLEFAIRLSNWTRLVYFFKEKSCVLMVHSVLSNFPNVVNTRAGKPHEASGETGSGVLAIYSVAFK